MDIEIVFESIILVVMIVLAVVGSSGVCWVTYDTFKSEPITAMLMMNLAATDLLKGLIEMPFALTTLVSGDPDRWLLGDLVCQVTAFISQTLRLASTLSVACVSIDRYCTILYALDYQTVMTQLKAKVMISLTWLIAAVISLLPTFGVGLYRFLPASHHCTADWTYSPVYSFIVLSLGFLVPLIITSYCNFRIFKAARSQSRRVDFLPSRGGDTGVGSERRRGRTQRQLWRPPRHRTRATKTILVVFGTFFCCWTTYVTVHIWNYARFDSKMRSAWQKEDHSYPSSLIKDPYGIHHWEITVVTFIAFSSAVINPYVYCLLNRRMRKTLRKLVFRLFCRGRVDYRRSTIVFAANINGRRGRSARQRMLNMKNSSLHNPDSDLHTSEFARRDSSSNREGLASLSTPLDMILPGDCPSSLFSSSSQSDYRDRSFQGDSVCGLKSHPESSVNPREYVVDYADEESDMEGGARYSSPPLPSENEGNIPDGPPAPPWVARGGSQWVQRVPLRTRRLTPLTVTRQWANRQLNMESTRKNRTSKANTVKVNTHKRRLRSYRIRRTKKAVKTDDYQQEKSRYSCTEQTVCSHRRSILVNRHCDKPVSSAKFLSFETGSVNESAVRCSRNTQHSSSSSSGSLTLSVDHDGIQNCDQSQNLPSVKLRKLTKFPKVAWSANCAEPLDHSHGTRRSRRTKKNTTKTMHVL